MHNIHLRYPRVCFVPSIWDDVFGPNQTIYVCHIGLWIFEFSEPKERTDISLKSIDLNFCFFNFANCQIEILLSTVYNPPYLASSSWSRRCETSGIRKIRAKMADTTEMMIVTIILQYCQMNNYNGSWFTVSINML